jgi:uncharacterized protein YdeI (BOF family)
MTMKKTLSFVLILIMLAASSAFAQDASGVRNQQPQATGPMPQHLLPPQTQANTATAKKSSGTSHKKRNIIIAVVIGVAAGVAIAAHNGAYGSSSNSTTGTGY